VAKLGAVIQPIKGVTKLWLGFNLPQPPGLIEPRYSRPEKRTMAFQSLPIMVYNRFLSSLLAQGIIPRFIEETKNIKRLEHEINRLSLANSS
jgi:hypothetical protein